MADLNERDIIAQTRRLAVLAPPPDASARAVAGARAALIARQSSHNAGRWRRTLFMTGSIAALLAVAIGLAAFLGSSDRADAAALLAQIADVNRAYSGWVHIRTDATDKSGKPLPVDSLTVHLNTATGTMASDLTLDGVRRVSLSVPASREVYEYDAARNEIGINDIAEFMANVHIERLRNYPLTVAAEVKGMEGRSGVEPTLDERSEDGLLRVDVVVPPAAPLFTTATTRPARLPRKATFWADPETKLLRRARYEDPDGTTYVQTFTYGAPAVESLHDLGVPRDARVVDRRATKELAALLDRLQRRADRGFGDGVVMLAKVDKHDGTADEIQLTLRQNGSAFSGKYLVGRAKPGGSIPVAPQPDHWPDPTADDVLRALKDARPITSVRSHINASPLLAAMRAKYDVSGQLWPTPLGLGITHSAEWTLMTDPARPGLVAVRIVRSTNDDEYRVEQTFWLDPARDDIPVESIMVNKAGEGSVIRTRTVYYDPKQTAAGQWYPSRWRKWPMYDPKPDADDPFYAEYSLRVYANHPIDPSWFTDPGVHLYSPASGPATAPTRIGQ